MPRWRLGGKWAALAAATSLLVLNFWAWSLLPPLAAMYAAELSLSPVALSALLAIPVIVGSLGRIPLGMLTDRYGGRAVFAVVCVLAGTAAVGIAASRSYGQLVIGGFCLGIAGASFAVGVPYVSGWFPKRDRGLALGVYALGNAGTALSGLLTPRLADSFGRPVAFLMVAGSLVAAGVLMALFGRNAPGAETAKAGLLVTFSKAAVWPATRKLALLYSITFGAFVAFGVYLPIILKIVYHLELVDAAARAAGFILLATATRPVGGWLSDRAGSVHVIRAALAVAAGLSVFVALQPPLMPYGTIAYLSLAGMLGLSNGAIFALVGRSCRPRLVGSVAGIVGAAGGLGGFLPPLVLGASLQFFHSYSPALLLLAGSCIAMLPVARGLSRASD